MFMHTCAFWSACSEAKHDFKQRLPNKARLRCEFVFHTGNWFLNSKNVWAEPGVMRAGVWCSALGNTMGWQLGAGLAFLAPCLAYAEMCSPSKAAILLWNSTSNRKLCHKTASCLRALHVVLLLWPSKQCRWVLGWELRAAALLLLACVLLYPPLHNAAWCS